MEALRKKIDTIDDILLRLLQERITIMKQLGEEKKTLQKPIRDQQRERKKLLEVEEKAKQLHVPLELVHSMWKSFFEISEKVEK